jgi:predicted AlkP superfamily phosphohydrolase/phosphomutase
MKTVLFGLDGATYTVLDHLVAEGIMPNLGELYRRGCRSRLQSTPMPITPQAWTSMATGRSAGHHGIHDFIRPEIGPNGVFWRMNDSRDNHCETIWQYASRYGKRVTVLNYIGTAPPRPINGHSMPGFVSGRHLRRSSYPPDLFDRLQDVDGFDVKVLGLDLDIEQEALQDMEPERWGEWIQHHLRREQVWFGIMDHLMATEPSDLTAIVFDGVDKIQHLAYRFLDPQLIPKDPTPWEAEIIGMCRTYFKQVDDFLGQTLKRVGRWGRVFVASDHGFTGTHEVVYINKWLHDQGYLRWRGEVAEDKQSSIFGDKLANLTNAIDLANTRAYALTPSCNGVYIKVAPEEYHPFREQLIHNLRQLKGPDGGQIITEIKKREEWFAGPYMNRVPDLTLTLRDFGLISVLNAHEAVVPRKQPAGTHHPHGILLGIGPGLRAGAQVELRNILEVAPMLLHSLGLEIPAEMEGEFPRSFYDPAALEREPPRRMRPADSAPAMAAVTAGSSEDGMDEAEQGIILERLKSLGYIE